jgi:two-component system phosphate regulon sensor histidine kinase PhoR
LGVEPRVPSPPSLFVGLLRQLLVAIVLICAIAAAVRIGAERERLVGEAAGAAQAAASRLAADIDSSVPHDQLHAVFDEDINPVRLSGDDAFSREAARTAALLRADGQAGQVHRWKPTGAAGEMIVIHAMRALGPEDGGLRTVVVGEPVRGMDAAARRIAIESLVLTLALALSAAWLVVRARATHRRAARRLSSTVSRIGRSERFRDLPEPPAAELDRLTRAISRTLDALTERIDNLTGQRAEAKAILRSMPGAVIALDLEQRVVNTNRVAERVLDLDPDATRGRLLHEVVRQPALLEFAGDSAGATDLRTGEFTLRGVTDRIVSALSRPLLSADGELVGVVIVLQDVTRLRKLENLRRDFAANASHELRTPVTNILGYIETLQECHDAAPEERANFIAIIRRNAERLAAIIEDMLELARLESPDSSGLRGLELTPLREMLEEVAGAFTPDLERKRIAIEVLAPENLSAELNRGLMSQAISNLVANAIRYSPEGTTIRLECQRFDAAGVGPQVEFAVADQGPGIAEEHLSRLFERFYRVDPARSRELGGTGLGLAIAKHVAMLHGGEIGVTSEPGRGSRFWIRTPQRASAGGRATPSGAPSPDGRAASPQGLAQS